MTGVNSHAGKGARLLAVTIDDVGIQSVKSFWESHPLFVGESKHEIGSRAFFEEHTSTVIHDCFAGEVDPRLLPERQEGLPPRVLDAGCGIGFWLEYFGDRGFTDVVGVDISKPALDLASSRLKLKNYDFSLFEADIENLPFGDSEFDHVNCQGVIHHTPNPGAAISELFRVLRPGETLSVSVYYSNVILRNFALLRPLIWLIGSLGVGLKGRGRGRMLLSASPEEIVRKFDGEKNPIGLSFSKSDFVGAVGHDFEVTETYLHFFPARAFNWLPKSLHRFLDRRLGFMIYISAVKPESPTLDSASG